MVAPAVGGLVIGYLAITAVVVAGVGALVTGTTLALTVLALVGAACLCFLGVRVLLDPGRAQAGGDGAALGSPWRHVARGIGVSALDPKGLLLLLSILPQFTRSDRGWPLPLQLAALGGIFVALVAVVYFLLGHGARRVLGARPRAGRIASRVAGAVMIVVGLGLVVEQLGGGLG